MFSNKVKIINIKIDPKFDSEIEECYQNEISVTEELTIYNLTGVKSIIIFKILNIFKNIKKLDYNIKGELFVYDLLNKIHLPNLKTLTINYSSQLKNFIEKIINPKSLFKIDLNSLILNDIDFKFKYTFILTKFKSLNYLSFEFSDD